MASPWRLTKKALLSLRSPSKCSYTLSKLRFFGLRKPKNSSFYSNLSNMWVARFHTPVRPFSRAKAPPLAIEGVGSKLAFEAGGEMIRKSQNKIKTNYYEKIFTFNFCRNAGGVQRAGRGGERNNHL